MARDYSQRPRGSRARSRRRSQGISRGTAFGVGICVGAIVTALIFVNGAKVNVDGIADRLRGRSQAQGPEETRFEFYTVLPGREVVVPDAPPPTPPPAGESASAPAAAPAGGDRFMLQAGSFRKAADADGQKARLALLGLEASIQTVNLGESGVWHRVRLGPYDGQSELGRVKSLLRSSGVEVMTTRLKQARAGDPARPADR